MELLMKSFRLSVGALAHPFYGIHRLRIVSPYVSTDCDQDVVDSLLANFATPSEPSASCGSYFNFMVFVKGDECFRISWICRQPAQVLLIRP